MVNFKIPIYGGSVKVFSNQEELIEEYNKYYDDEEIDLEGHRGITYKLVMDDETILYLIGVFDKKVSTLIHECSHVAIYIADHTGWVVGDSTSEPFCYLIETIYEECESILLN